MHMSEQCWQPLQDLLEFGEELHRQAGIITPCSIRLKLVCTVSRCWEGGIHSQDLATLSKLPLLQGHCSALQTRTACCCCCCSIRRCQVLTVHEQEVLGGLHSHLGSGQAAEVTTALGVLLSLAHSHSLLLLLHAAFISNLLDCLPSFTQPQVHQVRLVPSSAPACACTHCHSTLFSPCCLLWLHLSLVHCSLAAALPSHALRVHTTLFLPPYGT